MYVFKEKNFFIKESIEIPEILFIIFLVLYDTFCLVEGVCGEEFRYGATNKMMIVMTEHLSYRVRHLVSTELQFGRQLRHLHGFSAPTPEYFHVSRSQFSDSFIE